MKAEGTDLESKNLRLMRERFVAFFGLGIDSWIETSEMKVFEPLHKNLEILEIDFWVPEIDPIYGQEWIS